MNILQPATIKRKKSYLHLKQYYDAHYAHVSLCNTTTVKALMRSSSNTYAIALSLKRAY